MEQERIIENAVAALKAVGGDRARIGLILGSGLGGYAETLENKRTVDYASIEGFPVSGVVGHSSRFVVGEKAGKTVIVMQGRFHYYEGYPQSMLALGVRTMKRLGVESLLITNAAGGVNFPAGTLMLISDHINLSGSNPLIGKNLDAFGPRFPDLSNVYDRALRSRLKALAECELRTRYHAHMGVKAFMSSHTSVVEKTVIWRLEQMEKMGEEMRNEE